MIDWFVLLTPLLSLVLVLPFMFVGCAEIAGLEEPVLAPAGGGAYLSFDRALQVTSADLPAGVQYLNTRPIVSITVEWTLQQDESTTNPPVLNAAIQTKGSSAKWISTDDGPFHLNVDMAASTSHVRAIVCRCRVELDQGQETTRAVSLPYTFGAMHLFRLKRGTTLHPIPPVSEAPFSVVPETVKT